MMGPLVLPASKQLLFLFSLIGRKLINPKWKPYIPDFKQAFEHFCIFAGGWAVIDELQKNLQLFVEHMEASRMSLHRFGNTSSSSLWYELNYIEKKGRMKRGDRVWQIAFGSGFKYLVSTSEWGAMETKELLEIQPREIKFTCYFSWRGKTGFIQKIILESVGCIWFKHTESKDREIVARKLREHTQGVDNNPLLIFPEGTCVNNQYTVMLKKATILCSCLG
ncbi:uncharacterized protein A4U43_C09F12140 [Asparagus officinalis]|uniref:Very-long-chain 3-oxoacyl-CoA synthase n=1 Tax=Asparagus officinalis TaxID=4686 RepID=A0A5P1E766_ASPOF|nr:uncharacterized protein A4U43_C09F12140 [Asparagus officinalis]